MHATAEQVSEKTLRRLHLWVVNGVQWGSGGQACHNFGQLTRQFFCDETLGKPRFCVNGVKCAHARTMHVCAHEGEFCPKSRELSEVAQSLPSSMGTSYNTSNTIEIISINKGGRWKYK